MASYLFILFLLLLSIGLSHSLPTLLQITKDLHTHQYTTQLLIGTPPLPTKLVLHLSGQSLWLNNCPPSRTFLSHGSLQCLMAGPSPSCQVAPFGVCFPSQATVPEIQMVMQSQLVKWRIQGRNSMVEVSDSVMCLGFVDGGMGMTGSVILGGYQLEDHILEFDLGTGMMGFSSSLLNEGDSCSTLRESL
ncbi:putative aspartic peptidase A1 family, aspartic peptidase domain superfamily, xylanase inhibitor [Helianthus annuus]|nr:putative aspartic peptidase A1 family, aspartic peptidase domain superfamily, xylanase inhibitor [Helianthus annuus]KAJ0934740.1 putative aspartic peptidase A1 family, aspartic peptidase domain superfamily, xylanase inhibitor [Helianthus annuus]